MARKITDIIICERSVILTAGLVEVISQGLSEHYTIRTCYDSDKLTQFLNCGRTQILLSKPEVLERIQKKDYPNLKRISIVYAYYDNETLKIYDGVIQINDTQFQISELLYSLRDESNMIESPLTNDEILSSREIEVLKLLVSGLSTKELSEQLFISVHTVNNHRKNIIKKLGISTISGLTIYAVINNLIDPKQIMDSMK